MDERIIARILAAYGVKYTQILQPEKGYRNESRAVVVADGSRANVIIYKREPAILARIQNANRVADELHVQGLPVRHTLDARILQLRAGGYIKYAGLYAYLPGRTIPWEAYTQAHLKNLGGMLSTLHAGMRTLPRGDLPDAAAEYLAILGRMRHYFEQPGVQAAMQKKLGLQPPLIAIARGARLLIACQDLPNQQPLHLDFVRGNILFDEEAAITGVLDFEKTAWGHPALDIARTLAFLLVDCKYKTEDKIRKYFLISGYNKRGPARTPGSSPLLEELITAFLLHDFYKFLRHNLYESLHQNEHFVRTRNLLVRRGAF